FNHHFVLRFPDVFPDLGRGHEKACRRIHAEYALSKSHASDGDSVSPRRCAEKLEIHSPSYSAAGDLGEELEIRVDVSRQNCRSAAGFSGEARGMSGTPRLSDRLQPCHSDALPPSRATSALSRRRALRLSRLRDERDRRGSHLRFSLQQFAELEREVLLVS